MIEALNTCDECGREMLWENCPECNGEGQEGHDECISCRGRGGWYQCEWCEPREDDQA